MKFCNQCGGPVSLRIPAADDRHRYICDQCEYIQYVNPRIIVCTIPCYKDAVLLCRRAIEPRYGLWTLPGGFLENGETTIEGALRETREEACAQVSIQSLYAVYNLPHIDQVHMFFLSTLIDENFAAGEESLEVAMFTKDDLPRGQIAFPAVEHTLENYFQDYQQQTFPVRVADVITREDKERIIRSRL